MQYGAEPFELQQFGTAGVEGVNTYLPKKLRRHVTLTTPTWGSLLSQSRWKNLRTPRSVNRGPHSCILGASNSLAPALVARQTTSVKFGLKKLETSLSCGTKRR